MSQTIFSNITPTTTSGNQLATILNDFKNAIVSGMSGTSRPSALQAGGAWVDITNDGAGTWDYKIYTGTDDVTVFTLDKINNRVSISSADSLFAIERISADTVGPLLQLYKKRVANNGQTLSGDTLGEVQFKGYTDGGVAVTQARMKVISDDTVSGINQGAYIVFEATEDNTAAMVEIMSLRNKKVGIGTLTPENSLHVKGDGARVEKESDDAVGSKVIQKKKRIAGSGQVTSGDVIGETEYLSTRDTGIEISVAKVEVKATETHSSTAQGSSYTVSTKKNGETSFTENMKIENGITNIHELSSSSSTIEKLVFSGALTNSNNVADAASTGASAVLPAPAVNTSVLRLTNGSLTSVSGITLATAGRIFYIVNNTGNTIVLKHEDTGVTAANRLSISCGADVRLVANSFVIAYYNATTGRHMIVGGTPSSTKIEYFTLAGGDITNGYITLAKQVVDILDVTPKGYPSQWPTDDYTTSTVSNVTRITFAGDMLALIAGDKIKVVYTH